MGCRTPRQQRIEAVDAVSQRLFADPQARLRFQRSNRLYAQSGLTDYLIPMPGEAMDPHDAFSQLRWGGQFVYIDHRRPVEQAARDFGEEHGFTIESQPEPIRLPGVNLPLPGLMGGYHFFIARKTALIHPGEHTERYSYNVHLKRVGDEWVVSKQVPDREMVRRRLRRRMPGTDERLIDRGAHKLVDHVFPVFLTREAAFLKILEQRVPAAYRHCFPRILSLEQDKAGLVRRMHLNWLRMGGEGLPQIEFAHQFAELLHVLHDTVGLIHLDLRLDNVVVTDRGVGMIDFGSAVRMSEDLSRSPMLSQLFNEMMSTCQVQRVMGRMKRAGRLTSPVILDKHRELDKAADLFYLALQINKPHSNPDFKGLVNYLPNSEEALSIAKLTDETLRPSDPSQPTITSARQVLEAIERIEKEIGFQRPAA